MRLKQKKAEAVTGKSAEHPYRKYESHSYWETDR